MMQAHIIISGSVQGVGFRAFIKWIARKVHVTGWAKNLPDGRVESVLVGSESAIKKVIFACKKGPPLAKVENVEVKWEEATEKFDSFKISP